MLLECRFEARRGRHADWSDIGPVRDALQIVLARAGYRRAVRCLYRPQDLDVWLTFDLGVGFGPPE